ncbi:hypothetical protein NPIL_245161 [Nephila pilipes]|uniref:Uncharacterized protein n=1 Tax=Nephila pilipes TaxID=299642 RepID=A0A8X6MNC0_NEPPI|nr:hypothetical protein NPIL_245161 [Nephila pilipes]
MLRLAARMKVEFTISKLLGLLGLATKNLHKVQDKFEKDLQKEILATVHFQTKVVDVHNGCMFVIINASGRKILKLSISDSPIPAISSR